MNETVKVKKRAMPVDRITLNTESTRRVNEWLTQLRDKCPGIRMKRSDLIDWLIARHPGPLVADEVSAIGNIFYDQMQLAHWIVRQIKDAKGAGKPLTVQEVMLTKSE